MLQTHLILGFNKMCNPGDIKEVGVYFNVKPLCIRY
jgi:hypothetical protein